VDNLFAFLTLGSLGLLIIGLFKPRVSLFWLPTTVKRTWLKSVLVYSLCTVGCFHLFSQSLVNALSPEAAHRTFVAIGPPSYPQQDPVVAAALEKELLALSHDSTLSAAARRAARQRALARAQHTFSAKRLFDSYWADSVRADREFKGRAFYVLGDVSYIDCNETGQAVVTLNNDVMQGGAECYFANATDIATLTNRQIVLLRVVGRRALDRSAQLTNCVLLRTWPAPPLSNEPY